MKRGRLGVCQVDSRNIPARCTRDRVKLPGDIEGRSASCKHPNPAGDLMIAVVVNLACHVGVPAPEAAGRNIYRSNIGAPHATDASECPTDIQHTPISEQSGNAIVRGEAEPPVIRAVAPEVSDVRAWQP